MSDRCSSSLFLLLLVFPLCSILFSSFFYLSFSSSPHLFSCLLFSSSFFSSFFFLFFSCSLSTPRFLSDFFSLFNSSLLQSHLPSLFSLLFSLHFSGLLSVLLFSPMHPVAKTKNEKRKKILSSYLQQSLRRRF